MNWEQLLSSNRLRHSNRKKTNDPRNEFESDLGRIIFSPAIRRMHDKTQVFPLTTDDNIHSRLTHSMEVMSIGYSLGVKLCENDKFNSKLGKTNYEIFREIPIILKSSCLVHDIGNPPFGHFGETVVQNYFKEFFSKNIVSEQNPSENSNHEDKLILNLTTQQQKDFIHFDGNAQGFRVLTKLQILNDLYGLNLTFATLGSYIKYPNFELINENNIAQHKIGIFSSEIDYFKQVAKECDLVNGGDYLRHPLTYLMEAADSICYLTMDIEDGYFKKLLTLDQYYNKLKDIPSIKDELTYIYKDPENIYKNEITKVINFRIFLINKLVNLAIHNFVEKLDRIEKGNYNEELIFDDSEKLALTLKQFCGETIFKYREINSLEITGHSVIKGLLDYYIGFVFHKDKKYRKRAAALISESLIRTAIEESGLSENSTLDNLNDYYKLRVIVDFISGMTDQYALDHFQKISGQKIN